MNYRYAIRHKKDSRLYLIKYLESEHLQMYLKLMDKKNYESDIVLYEDDQGRLKQTDLFALSLHNTFASESEQKIIIAGIEYFFNPRDLPNIQHILKAIYSNDKKFALLNIDSSHTFIRAVSKAIVNDDLEIFL